MAHGYGIGLVVVLVPRDVAAAQREVQVRAELTPEQDQDEQS